jgi:hypothetical protein
VRAELYGDRFLALYLDITHSDPAAMAMTVRRYGLTWTILALGSPAAAMLAENVFRTVRRHARSSRTS